MGGLNRPILNTATMNEKQTEDTTISVTVTIVAFSDGKTVRACIDSLLAQRINSDSYDIEYRVLINNPKIIPPESLSDDYPDFTIIVPERNIGYAGAIAHCWRDCEDGYIVVTNDDLIFQPNWLEEILKPLEDSRVFASTCSIINEGETEEISNGTLNPIGIRIPDLFSDRSRVLFPSGAAFAFRKDDIEPVDSTYFLYFEDVYLGLLARLRGFEIVMNPESKANHCHQLSTGRMPKGQLHYYMEKNRIANILLFFSGWTLLRLLPYFIADFIIRIFQMLTLKRRPDAILRVWFYYLTHTGTTLFKRLKVGESRKVRDKEILSMMSGKLLPSKSGIAKLINSVFIGYAKLVGLNFVETIRKDARRK